LGAPSPSIHGSSKPLAPPQLAPLTALAWRQLRGWLAAAPPSLVVLEATGGLQTRAAAELGAAGLPVAVVNPRQVRDFARATEIQSEMSANSAKLLQLENGRQAMENAPRQPEPQMPPTDPVEDFASRLSPRSADWVRKHPEFVRDQRLNAKMIAAHNLAVADGIPTDTDEYFEAIEETLKVTPKNDTDDQYAAKAVRRRDAAPAAAPANRGGQSASSNVVRLSAAEREMAEMMGMKPEDYAKNKVALKKEGKIQ
jgi:hypothetical protein